MTKLKHTGLLSIAILLVAYVFFGIEATAEPVFLWSDFAADSPYKFDLKNTSETKIQDTIQNLVIDCPEDLTTYTEKNQCISAISNGLNINVLSGDITQLTWIMTGATNDASSVSGIHQIENYVFNEGTTIITYTASDREDDITCSFRITVVDNEPPVVIAPDDLIIKCNDRIPSPHTTLQAFLNAGGTASDNCGLLASSFEMSYEVKDNRTCPYTITRTYQIADINGNISMVKQRIIVTDEDGWAYEPEESVIGTVATASITKNDISCRDDKNGSIQLNVNGASGVLSYFWSTSNGSGIIQGKKDQQNLSAGDYHVNVYEDGVFLMKLNATIRVTDVEPPVMLAPTDITINCYENIPPAYTIWLQFERAGGSATDNCQLNYRSFRLYSETKSSQVCPYTITRTYSITDEYGNMVKAEQRIFVEGEENVTIQQPVLKSGMDECTASTGNWNSTTTWSCGKIPTSNDNVIIPNGVTVTIDGPAICNNISIESSGTLKYNGAFTLQVFGNWTNNGAYEGGTNGIVEFAGSNNAVISGNTNFEELIISKGDLNTTLTINGTNSVTSGGSLTMNSGLVTIPAGGSFTINPAVGLDIESAAGFDVTGGILTTGKFTITNEGLIRVSAGTANLGNSTGNEVHTQVDGAFIVTGGNVNISGRLYNSASGTLNPLGLSSGIHISGGTVTLATVGNGLSNIGSLNVTAAGTFDFSGGTIVFQNPSTAATELDLGLIDGSGTKNTVGGTFQFGNASTPAGSTFDVSSEIPLYNITTGGNANIALQNTLILGNPITLNGTSKLFLNDNPIQIPVTGNGTYNFPITDGPGNPIPVSINLNSGTLGTNPYIEVSTFDVKHPNNANSQHYLNRYWTLYVNNIANPSYSVDANYAAGDIVNASANIIAGSYASGWSEIVGATIGGNAVTFSSSSTNLSFSVLAEPTVTITNSDPEILCDGSSVTLTASATGDPAITYLWTSNPVTAIPLNTNPSVTVAPSAAPSNTITNYTYTVTVTDGNGFTASDIIGVTVNPVPTVSAIPFAQQKCPGESITQIDITNPNGVAGTTFSWTRDNTAVLTGIPASGSGPNINGSLNSTNPGGLETTTFSIIATANGCSSQTTVTVTVGDTDPPTALCQNVTVQLDAAGNISIAEDAINNGSNDACGSVTFDTDITSFDCSDIGVNPVILTVTDNVGNSATCSATVTVQDNVAPTAICKDITIQLYAVGNATITANDIDNGSSDACGIQSLIASKTSFDCSNIGVNTVTLTVTDNNGNSSTCDATVTVEDNVAPAATCQDITVQLDATGNVTIAEDAVNNASGDACGGITFDTNITSFGCGDLGINPVILTVTDNEGNSSTCNATVAVEDKIAPTLLTCPGNLSYSTGGGSCGRLVNGSDTEVTITDNCGVPSLTWSLTGDTNDSGIELIGNHSFNAGVTTVTYTATDASGNTAQCIFTVTVNDDVAPVLSCPVTITVNNSPGYCYATSAVVNLIYATATDNCNPNPTVTGTRNDGLALSANYPVGTTTIAWTASDGTNSSTCTQTVEVVDNEMPTFTAPSPITINSGNSCNPNILPTISGNVVSKLDNCTSASNLIVTYIDDAPVLSGCSGNYTITRNWYVEDLAGNVAMHTQLITIEDHTAPLISVPANLEVECDEDQSPVNTGTATATDNCSTSAEIAITYSDAEVNNGCLNHRITRTWTATDCAGNSSSANQIITITDLTPPVFTDCPADWHVDTPDDIPPPENVPLTVMDNCGGPVNVEFITEDYTGLEEGAGFCPRTVRRVFEATDECGNKSTCEYIIYVDNLDDCYICQSTVPLYHVDLVGQPSGSITLEDIRREQEGVCCDFKYKDQLRCVSFNIELDPQTIAVTMLVNGALPNPKDYRINCYDVDPIGDVVCLPGDDVPAAEFYNFVYCKEGNNPNDFTFIYHSGVVATGDLTTRVDCSGQIDIDGVTESSVTFTDLSGNGYERYLNHASADLHPIFTPDEDAPGVVRYEVCGDFEGETTVCQGGYGCGIVEITVLPKIEIEFDIDEQAICENDPPVINVSISPEPSPLYTYEYWWYNGYDAQGTPINSISTPSFQPSIVGPYSIKVVETKTGVICNSAIHNFDWEYDVYPPRVFAPAGDLTILCNDPAAPQLIADWLESASIRDDEDNILPLEPDNDYAGIIHACGERLPVTFSADDECGNIGTAVAYIIVDDNTAPIWITAAGALDRTVECSDAGAMAAAQALVPVPIDECDDDATLNPVKVAGIFVPGVDCPQAGTITNTWTVTDDCGNTSEIYTQRITIVDTEPPVITTDAADALAECDGAGNITELNNWLNANGGAVASDNCGNITWTNDFTALSDLCGETGAATVIFTAADDCGNAATTQATFTIEDTEPPVFTYCPPAANNVADPDLCLIEEFTPEDPLVDDNCTNPEDIIITWEKTGTTSGTGNNTVTGPFNVGVTTVTYTATDACGNTATCEQQITIEDAQKPDIIECPDNVIVTAPPPDCELEVINIDPLIYTDNCNTGTSVVTWIKTDEEGIEFANGAGDVNGTPFPTGVTTVTYIVTDLSGNSISCTFTVTVNDEVPPTLVDCYDTPIVVTAIPGECSAYVDVPAPTADDPCGEIVSITHDSKFGESETSASGIYPVGTYLVTWTLTDRSGNTNTLCQVEITVIDLQVLAIDCPDDITQLADQYELFASGVAVGTPMLYENCHAPVLTWIMEPPVGYETMYSQEELAGTGNFIGTGTYYIGTTTIYYTLTDTLDNTANCSFTVTIESAPIITCPPSVTVYADDDCTYLYDPGIPTLNQGGQPITWTWQMFFPDDVTLVASGSSQTPTDGSEPLPVVLPAPHEYDFPLGTTTIKWRAENDAGFDECSHTITVIDITLPVIFELEPIVECVSPIINASYDAATDQIIPARPDYVQFDEGDIWLDIDIPDFSDNCDLTTCAPYKVRWRIAFNDGSGYPTNDPNDYVDGQPSAVNLPDPGNYIRFPGDGILFQDVEHTIYYQIIDCNNNVSAGQGRLITIKPRPKITQMW